MPPVYPLFRSSPVVSKQLSGSKMYSLLLSALGTGDTQSSVFSSAYLRVIGPIKLMFTNRFFYNMGMGQCQMLWCGCRVYPRHNSQYTLSLSWGGHWTVFISGFCSRGGKRLVPKFKGGQPHIKDRESKLLRRGGGNESTPYPPEIRS